MHFVPIHPEPLPGGQMLSAAIPLSHVHGRVVQVKPARFSPYGPPRGGPSRENRSGALALMPPNGELSTSSK